ncbi:protein suppressor 2 of zeste-like [Teleopsis dalmanni]|uniref:protein suppressor 2 of zeste-like n=1 Tax=Teleopsis dalmanni TaxID=139649 RepID=UPI0018CF1A3C|nr:protein suppressor 2 of zeste-like [Teleopsis dalmanni]
MTELTDKTNLELTHKKSTGKTKLMKNKESKNSMKVAKKSNAHKKASSKRSSFGSASLDITHDFKSLRSNDMRFSDYSTTTTVAPTANSAGNARKYSQNLHSRDTNTAKTDPSATKCDIVVTIPHSQLAPSILSEDDETLAQLKNACKKNPPPKPIIKAESPKKSHNVPKLKIDMSSLKTKLTIPKPKSADARFEAIETKKVKHRKHSFDDSRPIADKVDLETYAKNIGLKPIDVQTANETAEQTEKFKYSPNASPMSSSSSTTSSSNSNFNYATSADFTSSSHKKRKKKHSKDSKDVKESKRRKLHAEISSQPADESLKMKVKITAAHSNHKAHKTESKKIADSDIFKTPATESERFPVHKIKHSESNNNRAANSFSSMLALNKALCEESQSINNLIKTKTNTEQKTVPGDKDVIGNNNTVNGAKETNLLPKPIANIIETNIPSSPPLPPSLFKPSAMTLGPLKAKTTTFLKNPTESIKQPTFVSSTKEETVLVKPALSNPKTILPGQATLPKAQKLHTLNFDKKGINQKPQQQQQPKQQFAVPNPPRPLPNAQKYFSTPTSIASSANKQAGMQLKRSISLDESNSGSISKLHKLEQDRLMRKSAYGPYSTNVKYQNQFARNHEKVTTLPAKATELPFYSQMTIAYGQGAKRHSSQMTHTPINISKNNSKIYNAPCSTSAVTITPRSKTTTTQPSSMMSFPNHGQGKPAVEIVRISTSHNTVDLLPLPTPLSPPVGNRLTKPPIGGSHPKKEKIAQQKLAKTSPTVIPSPPLNVPKPIINNSYNPSPPVLVNLHNTIPLMLPTKTAEIDKPNEIKKTNGCIESKKTSSLRDFRPTAKDNGVEILDLSAGKINETKTTEPVVQNNIGNSLEAALNKIKQNISANNNIATKSNSMDERNEDLQNLQLLSESATTRERLAIKTQFYDKPKLQQPYVVRQQNASVRNIPNPSALAFRNQPTIVSTIAATLTNTQTTAADTVVSATTTTTATSPNQHKSALSSPSMEDKIKLPLNNTTLTMPTKSACSTTQISTVSSLRPTKKPTTIDQVAANLNIRAAAAEASAAKAAAIEESTAAVNTAYAVNTASVNAVKPKHVLSEVSGYETVDLTIKCESPTKSVEEKATKTIEATTTPKISVTADVVQLTQKETNNNNHNNKDTNLAVGTTNSSV